MYFAANKTSFRREAESGCWPSVGLFGLSLFHWLNLAPRFIQLTSAQLWQRLEFCVTNVPSAANPFDPDQIRLDATFTLPSGKTMTVPAFWFQDYQRGLSGGYEYLTAVGSPQWRLRFTPVEPGTYSVSLIIQTNNQPYGSPVVTNFTVPAGVVSRRIPDTCRWRPTGSIFKPVTGRRCG